jgi:hypothetical protein
VVLLPGRKPARSCARPGPGPGVGAGAPRSCGCPAKVQSGSRSPGCSPTAAGTAPPVLPAGHPPRASRGTPQPVRGRLRRPAVRRAPAAARADHPDLGQPHADLVHERVLSRNSGADRRDQRRDPLAIVHHPAARHTRPLCRA